jgi:putative peptide zinc metalloprotease protein
VSAPRTYKLRDDLVIRRRVFSGEVKYVVKDPLRLDYYTVDEMSYTLLSLCNGKLDLAEQAQAADRLFPNVGLNALTLLNFYETYRGFHFFEDAWERNVLLIERRRTNRAKTLKRAFANPLEIHLPAWNPDRFFGRIVKFLRPLFTVKALLVYAVVFLGAMWIMVTNADRFALGLGELWVIQGKTFLGIVTLWFILLFTVVLHEMGHGLTCKHFGGGVFKIGFLFLYFNPCMYCDVTESYFFENKNHKHAVTLAGGIVDLMTASIATFIWFLTPSDLFVNQVAHRVALFNGVTGILVNYNPLMKYDGYFLVADHLGVPNLRGDSFRFLGIRMRRLFGLPHEDELTTPRERRIFWIFGIAAVFYSLFVLWFVVHMVGGFLVAHLRATGYLITAGLVLLMTKRYIKGFGGFVRFFAADKAGHFRRWRLPYGAGALAFLAFFFLAPLPRHVRGGFTLRPGNEMVLRAREAGVVERVEAGEGDTVAAGAAPVIVRSDAIRLTADRARAAWTEASVGRAAAQAGHDPAEAAIQEADAASGRFLARQTARREELVSPAAPDRGVVLTPRLEEKLGLAVAPGDTLCVLGDVSTLRAAVLVDEQDLGILDAGAPVELRTEADPGRLFRGRVEGIAPEPSGGAVRRLYKVTVVVENPGGRLRPGMTGIARFGAGTATPYHHLTAGLARLIRIQFWI